MFSNVPLGAVGLSYVRDQLRGGHTLARLVAANMNDFCRAYTILPSSDPLIGIDDLRSGRSRLSAVARSAGIVEVPDTTTVLSQLVHTFIEQRKTSVAVFENALADAADSYLKRAPNVLVYKREVYHLIQASARGSESVAEGIRTAKSVPECIGILTTHPGDFVPAEGRTLVSYAHLEMMALAAEIIIVGAYDGESYVVAER